MSNGGLVREERGHWMLGFVLAKSGGNPLLSKAQALKVGPNLTWD